jgi:DNA-binding MarR family transcriptional regulator
MTDHNAVPDELLKRCERVLWRTLPSVIHATRKLSLDEEQDSKQLTPAQYYILRNIHRGSKSVSDLAECEKVSPPAVSRHVDDLVKMGLVERTRDTEDRRSIILGLTDQGQTIWNKMIERNHQLFSEKMRQLSTQEIETIIEGLDLLYSAFTNQVLDSNCQANGGKHQHE